MPNPPAAKKNLITPLVASTVFGFLAGLVGTIVGVAVIAPAAPESPVTVYRTLRPSTSLTDDSTAFATEAAGKTLVLFFDRRSAAKFPVDGVFLPEEALAAGVVVTSDGWLLTSAASFPASVKAADRAVAVAGRRYDIKSIVRDAYSGLAFVKIDAANLPVSAFSANSAVAPGEALFALDAGKGLRRVSAIGAFDLPAERDSLAHSSERVQKVLRLSSVDGVLPGAGVMNRNGEVVGVFAGPAAKDSSYAVPFSAVSGEIDTVFRDGNTVRPFFGVSYVDLAHLVGADAQAARGALVAGSPDGKLAAVAKRGPAAAAGLHAGDIVLSVNGEDVSSRRGLADIVADYAPGAKLSLVVRRAGADLDLSLTLGRLGAE